jgi:hypothetical protein
MTLRRLPDEPRWQPQLACRHPEHNPPNAIVLDPGKYEHTCPGCGHVVIFIVGGTYSLTAGAGTTGTT